MEQQPKLSYIKPDSPSSREVVLSRLVTRLEKDMKGDTSLRNRLSLGITKYNLSSTLENEPLVKRLFAAYLLDLKMSKEFVVQVVRDIDEERIEHISSILELPKEGMQEGIVIPLDNTTPSFNNGEQQFEIGQYDKERIEYLRLTLLRLNLTYDSVITGLTPQGLNRRYSYQLYTLSNGLIVAMCPQEKEATYIIKPNEDIEQQTNTQTTQYIANLTKQEIKKYCNTNQLPLQILKHDKQDKWRTKLTNILQNPEILQYQPKLTHVDKLYEAVKIMKESGKAPSEVHVKTIVKALTRYKNGVYKTLPIELTQELDHQLELLNQKNIQRFRDIIEYMQTNGKRPTHRDKNPEIEALGSVLNNYKTRGYKNLPIEIRQELDTLLANLKKK
jgi:hypothetical protein